MAFAAINAATATLTSNLVSQGRIVLVDPIGIITTTPPEGFIDLGYFPTDQVLAPTINSTTEDIKAAGREDGTDITVDSNVTGTDISYDIRALSPDSYVRQLHAGAAPVTLTTGALEGVTGYPFDPNAKVDARAIILRKRKGGGATVVWHPRTQLRSNGEGSNPDTLNFALAVRPFTYTPGSGMSDFAGVITQYGAKFEAHNAAELDALLTALQSEATS